MFNALTSTFLRKTIPTQPTEPGRPTPLPQNSLLRYPGQQLPQQQHLDKAGLLVTQELSKAIDRCKAKVRRIVKDCKRRNCRFRDIEFDLEEDRERCLHGLMTQENERFSPAGVSRIHQIFEDPKFFIGRPESTDIVQGALGDCWFLSALGTVATVPGLIEKMCVDRDEKAGVYGFIFWRDCEWVDVIIDDQLFVSVPHYEELSYKEKTLYHQDKEKYNLAARKGGKTLFFARSRQENETWVPLIEKAFAKLHGDFASMDGGHCDEAAEDLTGGVSTVFHTNDIMDPNEFWESEMLRANYDRAFACYLYSMPGVDETISVQVEGLLMRHSYSVIKATEVKNRRFLKIRNPWSRAEWTGRWSDGSKEWSGEWLEALDALDHQFGDDGVFIMEYEDFLNTWTVIVRTRIFDSSWCMSSHWLNCKPRSFPCAWDYGDISFTFTLPEPTFAVVVLGQLDDRYFRDISGTSAWTFDFVIYKKGDTEIYHSSAHSVFWKRTQHLEGEFESGDYVVHVRLDRSIIRDKDWSQNLDNVDKRKLSRVMAEAGYARSRAINFDRSNQNTVLTNKADMFAGQDLVALEYDVYSKQKKARDEHRAAYAIQPPASPHDGPRSEDGHNVVDSPKALSPDQIPLPPSPAETASTIEEEDSSHETVAPVEVSMTLSVKTNNLTVRDTMRTMSSPIPEIPGSYTSARSTLGLSNGITHDPIHEPHPGLASRPPSPPIPNGVATINHSPVAVVPSLPPVQPSFNATEWKCFGCERNPAGARHVCLETACLQHEFCDDCIRNASHPADHHYITIDGPDELDKLNNSGPDESEDVVLGLRVYTNRRSPATIQGQLRHGTLLQW